MEILERVYTIIEDGKVVAIHCLAGVSRSATFLSMLILKYYMEILELEDVDDVLTFLEERRPKVDSNPGFVLKLYEFAEDIK